MDADNFGMDPYEFSAEAAWGVEEEISEEESLFWASQVPERVWNGEDE